MATEQELKQALIKADTAGDTQAAQLFADKIKQIRQPRQPEKFDPNNDAPTPENIASEQQRVALNSTGTLKDKAIGLGDAALTVASSVGSDIAGGLSGVVQAANPWAEQGAGALSYRPASAHQEC